MARIDTTQIPGLRADHAGRTPAGERGAFRVSPEIAQGGARADAPGVRRLSATSALSERTVRAFDLARGAYTRAGEAVNALASATDPAEIGRLSRAANEAVRVGDAALASATAAPADTSGTVSDPGAAPTDAPRATPTPQLAPSLETITTNFGKSGATYEDGDLNGDGRVDLADLGLFASTADRVERAAEPDRRVLEANFGKSGATYEEGDLNGDGRVDLVDLGMLAARSREDPRPPLIDTGTYELAKGTARDTMLADAGAEVSRRVTELAGAEARAVAEAEGRTSALLLDALG